MISVRLFGGTRVVVDGEERPVSGVKPRQILEILAAHVGQPVPKDRLADLLWDGRPPRSYVGSLESYVCNLRRALQLGQGRGSVLRTTTGGYLLDATQVSVDLADFRALVQDVPTSGGREAAERVLEALRLVTGPLLASESTLLWADEERAAFGQLLTGACLHGAAAARATGDAAAALSVYERVLAHDELLEAAWVGRMQALADLGRRVEALRCYGELRKLLRSELGILPSSEAHSLYLAVLEGEGESSARARMDRAELKTLLTLLRDALEPIPGVLGSEKVKALSELAADVLASAPSISVAPMRTAAAA